MLRLAPSLTSRARSRRAQAGMTLIELMIVLAISGLMVGMVMFSMSSGRVAEIVRATNQLANTVRFGFNKARVTGKYYRLNINIKERTFALQSADERMYMPATDRNGEIIVVDESKKRDQEERDKRAEETYNRSIQAQVYQGAGAGAEDAPAPAADSEGDEFVDDLNPYAAGARRVPRRKPPVFQAFEDENTLSQLKKPFKFPDALEIVSFRTTDEVKDITDGEANLYFFPQGRTQHAHIQVRQKGSKEEADEYTIIIHPLTGRVEIKEGLIPLKVSRDPRDDEDDAGRRQNRRVF